MPVSKFLTFVVWRLILVLSLISTPVYAKENDTSIESIPTNVQLIKEFDHRLIYNIDILPDLVEKEEKISECMKNYIQKQTKSYSKIAKNNLYDLIHNFDKVSLSMYGKKSEIDNIPIHNKIEVLARLQCEAYYTLKILK